MRELSHRSALVMRGRRGRNGGSNPASVEGGPLPICTHLRQDSVDKPDEVSMLLRDRQAVGLACQWRADDLGFWVLRGKPCQDRVIGRDSPDLALLQEYKAIGPVRNGDRRRYAGVCGES